MVISLQLNYILKTTIKCKQIPVTFLLPISNSSSDLNHSLTPYSLEIQSFWDSNIRINVIRNCVIVLHILVAYLNYISLLNNYLLEIDFNSRTTASELNTFVDEYLQPTTEFNNDMNGKVYKIRTFLRKHFNSEAIVVRVTSITIYMPT